MTRLFYLLLLSALRRFASKRPERATQRKPLFPPQTRAARTIEGEFRRLAARHN